MKIKVCQTHIDKGQASSMRSCPIALAIKAHPTMKKLKKRLMAGDVNVDDDSVRIHSYGPRYLLPFRAKMFIDRFDEGFKVKPFTFTLTRNKTLLHW